MEPIAYTIKEATEVARVGRTLLYERIAIGEIPVIRIGRRTLISHASLCKWLEEHVTTGCGPGRNSQGRRGSP